MIGGTTKTGFTFEVDERMLQDWRLTKALVKTQKGTAGEKLIGADEMISLLLGDKTDDLMSHLMELNEGFAPMDKLMEEITDIMASVKAKNSSSSPS